MRARVRALASAERLLPVVDDGRLHRWWPSMHRHIPGATTAVPVPTADDGTGVDVTGCAQASHVRRVINAHLHLLHLEHDTLSVHAAALTAPDQDGAVLLLGGHGAGKTLVAIALALKGWTPIAGDVALVHVDAPTAAVVVVGGTAAFMARTAPISRWFPHVPLPNTEATDLEAVWPSRPARVAAPVLGAVWVRVDGDPQMEGVQAAPMDAHTARTAWWKAGSHLLDRLAPPGHDPLRLLESPALARRRAALTTTVAERFPPTVLCGDPYAIAAAIGRHIREGSNR